MKRLRTDHRADRGVLDRDVLGGAVGGSRITVLLGLENYSSAGMNTRFRTWLVASVLLLMVACGDDGPTADETAADPSPTVEVEAPSASPVPPTPVPPTEVPTVAPTATPEPSPERYDAAGPWMAGVLTVTVNDRDVEIWYPVEPGEVAGQDSEIFDALGAFPENLQALIPSELSGEFDTGAFRDAPPADGEFPAVIYGHGFGGYRQVATTYTTHLASWGYVVASMDHLERGLAEQALDTIGQGAFDETNQRENAAVADVQDLLDLMVELNTSGALAQRIDGSRVAITGHSAGAWAAVESALAEPERIQTWVSIAGGAASAPPPQPGVVVIGELDAVVEPERSEELFASTTSAALLVNIANAGHNSFTDACFGIRDIGGLGSLVGLLGEAQVARAEDGCVERFVDPAVAQQLLNHVTVAHLRTEFGQDIAAGSLDRGFLEEIAALADYRVSPE